MTGSSSAWYHTDPAQDLSSFHWHQKGPEVTRATNPSLQTAISPQDKYSWEKPVGTFGVSSGGWARMVWHRDWSALKMDIAAQHRRQAQATRTKKWLSGWDARRAPFYHWRGPVVNTADIPPARLEEHLEWVDSPAKQDFILCGKCDSAQGGNSSPWKCKGGNTKQLKWAAKQIYCIMYIISHELQILKER